MTPEEVLFKYWGFPRFRVFQEQIIQSVLLGKDTLALLPTGGGKSITFQVPAMVKDGLVLVISPLIALMKDQTVKLKEIGIFAEFLHSGLRIQEIDRMLDNCIYGNIKLLYVSPERLSSPLFLERVQKMNVSLIAVDEAHCISQWGYDFRPSYLKIIKIREYLPRIPVLALTATATILVREDIQKQLGFKQPKVFVNSFKRPNIFYQVVKVEDKLNYLLKEILACSGTILVYTRNRQKTQDIAHFLQRNNIKAGYYHAGLSYEDREKAQEDWILNIVQVMVATNAFGMGIDKSGVRLVIHYSPPDNIESYYQESGRAGRDGRPAKAILLFEEADKKEMWHLFSLNFPDEKLLRAVYEELSNFLQIGVSSGENLVFEVELKKFVLQFASRHSILEMARIYSAIRILTRMGYWQIEEKPISLSKIQVLVSPNYFDSLDSLDSSLIDLFSHILRKYEGVLDELVPFSEVDMAKVRGMEIGELYKQLNFMKQAGIIQYIARSNSTSIVYLKNRERLKDLIIDMKMQKKLRLIHQTNLESMVQYFENTSLCRARALVNYFEEPENKDCGNCDVCMNKTYVENDIRFQILQKIDLFPLRIRDVSIHFPANSSEKVLYEIQHLLEQDILSVDEAFVLRRKG